MRFRLTPSMWALVGANLLPLVGVLVLGWDLGSVMMLFWAENAVIGVYHILRMALVTGWLGVFLVPFFTFHYGLFTLGHGVFVYAFFVLNAWGREVDESALTLEPLRVVVPGVLALLVSHGASFYLNFLRGGERDRMRRAIGSLKWRKTGPNSWSADVAEADLDADRLRGFQDAGRLMTAPYRRVIVMHLTIIFGGILAMSLGSPKPALALLVALKTAFDLRAHKKEHERLASGT